MLAVFLPINYERAGASTVNDMRENIAEIINEACGFINDEMNEDGSLGDVGLINDTAEAAAVLKRFTGNDCSKIMDWIKTVDYDANTDTLARMAMADDDSELLAEILSYQNSDGGFGLTEEYQSDILDALLVLEAVNSSGSNTYGTQTFRLVSYIARQVNSDGSFSYTKASEGNIILSAMALYTVSKYMTDNNIRSDLTTSMMSKTYQYLIQKFDASFPEETIEENLYIALALAEYQSLDNPEAVVETLKKLQKEDGSFYENIHITILVIWLLGKLDVENMAKIYDMQTSNTDTAYYGIDTEINVNYAIAYNASVDGDYQIKCTVMNGDEIIYDGEKQTITLGKEQSIIQGSMESFYINENCDDGIVVITELYYGDTVIKACTGSITMENQPRAGETELTDFSLSLNHYYTYVNAAVDISAEYKLIYTTNVENSVDMQVIVSKDNSIISDTTFHEELMPENDVVKRTGVEFTPDVSEAGSYEITVRCIYEGDIIAERTAEFIIAYVSGQNGESNIATGSDADLPTSFKVSWIGPMLSDYCLYAGKETEIDVSYGILYYSPDSFSGKAVINVTDGDTVIAEVEEPITLSQNSGYYEADDVLKFIVKDIGSYTVTVTLYDAEEGRISSGSRIVQVFERNKIAFISDSSISDTEEQTVDISWNDISNSQESYNYRLYRRYDGTDWEPRSVWNESDKIKVLNVYPSGPYLASWMNATVDGSENTAGMGIFDIGSVHIADFNSNPKKYLFDENGKWTYDVIFFGSADNNSGYDLGSLARVYIQEFIDSGRGVLFGHDTLTGALNHTQFNSFSGQLGLRLYYNNSWNTSTTVSVNTLGTLTNFPWKIRGTLTIPNTHSTGQFVNNDSDTIEWMTLNAYQRNDGEGYHDSFYLITRNNLGMIQTGHSSGQASDDERKVLANTLFYLHQISQVTTAKDNSFYDLAAPDMPEIEFFSAEDNRAEFKISAKDNGTKYQYYIEAIPGTDDENAIETSNIMTETAISGIKGYLYEVTDSEEPDTALITYDENNEIVQNVEPADEDGTLAAAIEIPDFEGLYYLHIYAVDNENNVSDELIVPLSQGMLTTNISTDKEIYEQGETVSIASETSSLPYSFEGDVSLSLYDGEGNYLEEIYYENNQIINAGEPYQVQETYILPDEYSGEYSVKVQWTKGAEIIAYAYDSFNVVNNDAADDDEDTGNDSTDNTGKTSEGEVSLPETDNSSDKSDETEKPGEGSTISGADETSLDEAAEAADDTVIETDKNGESQTAIDTGDYISLRSALLIMLAAVFGMAFVSYKRRKE